jgi:hypothetical protein
MIVAVHSEPQYVCRRRLRRSSPFASVEIGGQWSWIAEEQFVGSDRHPTLLRLLVPFYVVPHCLVGRRHRMFWSRYHKLMVWNLSVVVHQHRISRQAGITFSVSGQEASSPTSCTSKVESYLLHGFVRPGSSESEGRFPEASRRGLLLQEVLDSVGRTSYPADQVADSAGRIPEAFRALVLFGWMHTTGNPC